MEKLLTISIAAYNVEQYLEKLLNTIAESGVMDKIEVLVVNDGSKDRTVEIAEKYHTKFKDSIFLIDKENGGHGSTINKGIEKATGKYFKVIDGDDWVNPEELKKLIYVLENEDSDVLLCDYEEHYIDNGYIKKIVYDQFEPGKKITFDQACAKLDRILMHAVVFKTKIMKKVDRKIDEHCFYVDVEYVLHPTPYLKTFTYYPFSIYCYRLGDINQSMSFLSLQKNINQHKKVSKNMLAYCSCCYGKCEPNVKKYILSSMELLNHKTYEILFSFPCDYKYAKEIAEFDQYIKDVFPEAYNYMHSKTICVMRKNIMLMYPIAWLWLRTKKCSR